MKRKIPPMKKASLRIVNMGRGCGRLVGLEERKGRKGRGLFGGGEAASAGEAVHAECRILRESIVGEAE